MKRKNLLFSLVAAVAFCFALAACGGGAAAGSSAASAVDKSGFVGVWELESMTEAEQETTSDDLETLRSYGLNVYLVLSDDGKAELDLFGEELTATWDATSATEGSLLFDEADEDTESSGSLVLQDEKLLLMGTDGTSMTFAATTKEEMDALLENSDGLNGLLDSLDELAGSAEE